MCFFFSIKSRFSQPSSFSKRFDISLSPIPCQALESIPRIQAYLSHHLMDSSIVHNTYSTTLHGPDKFDLFNIVEYKPLCQIPPLIIQLVWSVWESHTNFSYLTQFLLANSHFLPIYHTHTFMPTAFSIYSHELPSNSMNYLRNLANK